MSNYFQPGYLFGILQRGANPLGQASRARRMPSRPLALEQSGMSNDVTSPPGIDASGKSFPTPSFNRSTSRDQTNQAVDPQIRQSQPRSPSYSVDVSPEELNAPAAFPQADSKHADAASEALKTSASTTLSEMSSTTELSGTTPDQPQRNRVVQPQTRQSQSPSLTLVPDSSPEKPSATATRSHRSTRPQLAVDSSSQGTSQSATQLVTNLLPVTDPVQTKVKPLQSGTQTSEPRLPRLIVIEQGGKTVVADKSSRGNSDYSSYNNADQSSSSNAESRIVSEESRDTFESHHFAAPSTGDSRPSPTPPLSDKIPTIRSRAEVGNPTQANRIPIRTTRVSGDVQVEDQSAISSQASLNEAIESVSTLPAPEVTVARNLRAQRTSAISLPTQPESSQNVIGSVPEDAEDAQETPVADFGVRPRDSIAERLKAPGLPARTEMRAEPLTRTGSLPEQTEEQFSRRFLGSQRQRDEPAPKLTINRLDVQIVNQSPQPAAPGPGAPAPPALGPPADSWERLERHQLGHLDLIF